ncbi:hypothetical protein GBAR_LOCUS7406 [Geodia barretti]|uniref:Death domain-containing protein n=1 Tax=Geodia barretti TaxID=519541 RepID=A0AA35WEE6_GEOBA|nr:hypothetical protein GBAR_LOCUS7406 [Geodia barretti]
MLSLEQQKTGLVDKWIERNGHTATYRALAKCLFEAGALDSVDRLCREFGTTSTPTVVPDGGPTIPPPTMKELMNNVHTVKTFELGIQLDLDLSDVNTAMADHKNDARGQLIKILSLYIQQTMDPSWLHVATALYTIGENKCAADIEQRFGFRVPSEVISSTFSASTSEIKQPVPVVSPDFKKAVSRGDKVYITSLSRFPTPAGTINILQRVGPDYKPLLGNILLRSEDGQRIRALEMTHSHNVDGVVYDMFQKWITEDEDCTWGALVLHLQHASLGTLARDILSALI